MGTGLLFCAVAFLGVLLPLVWAAAKTYRNPRYRVVLVMPDGSEAHIRLTAHPSPGAISLLNSSRRVAKVEGEMSVETRGRADADAPVDADPRWNDLRATTTARPMAPEPDADGASPLVARGR